MPASKKVQEREALLKSQWLERYMQTGDATEAVKELWPEIVSPASKGSHLKREFELEIAQRLDRYKKDNAVLLFNHLNNLATKAKSETVQLNATVRWLEMAGHKEATVIEHKQTYENLQNRLKQLLSDPETVQALEKAGAGNVIDQAKVLTAEDISESAERIQ